VTVGVAAARNTYSSILYALYSMIRNKLWPTMLGGGTREYVSINGFIEPERLERIRDLVAEGKLRVVVDKEWEMGGVLEVSLPLVYSPRGKVLIV
jgi:hypothetical protein